MDPLDISEILGNPVDDGTLEKQSLHTKSKLEDQQKEQAGSQDDREVSNSIVVSESLLNGSFNPTNYNFNDPKIQLFISRLFKNPAELAKFIDQPIFNADGVSNQLVIDVLDIYFGYQPIPDVELLENPFPIVRDIWGEAIQIINSIQEESTSNSLLPRTDEEAAVGNNGLPAKEDG